MNAPSELHRITVDPQVCGGRPCIRDTRVRVSDILELLAAGADAEEILSDYPYLQRQDIAAARASCRCLAGRRGCAGSR